MIGKVNPAHFTIPFMPMIQNRLQQRRIAVSSTQIMKNIMTELPLHGVEAASVPAMAKAESRGRLTVDVARTVAELDALAAEWRELERLSGPASVFQSHAQIRIWARHFLSGGQRLHIVVVREGGRAVLILPLVVSGRWPVRIACLAGDPIAQYADFLFDPQADGKAAIAAALASVRRAGADVIILRRVRADSHLLALGGDALRPPTGPDAAPYAEIGPHPTYEAYLQTLSKNMRKGLRNRRHHLEKAGDVAFELLEGGPAARAAVADAIGLKRRWMIQRGAVSTAFVDPATRECLLDLAEDNADTGAIVMRLTVKDEPAAIRFGFEYRGGYFAYISAYDQHFAHLAPGKMIMDFYVARCKEREIGRIDMLPPVDRHKTDWCRFETAVADYTLPFTYAGRAYAEYYQERLRPALRRAWYRLPDNVRSLASTLFVNI
jgi:CelD/BcsL family acetyltransferase involved in cellulose biosynthesis